MRKVAKSSVLLDRLHKGAVCVCIALTLYGTSHLGMRWYRYFTVLRPDAQQKELQQKELLLAEGSSSDVLQDKAADLKT